MKKYRLLCDAVRERKRTTVCDAIEHCRLFSFVRRFDEVLPCDEEDVDFLHSPVESYCAEMYDGLAFAKRHYNEIHAVVAHEYYPTQWQFVVLLRSKTNSWKYVASDELEFKPIKKMVLAIHKDCVRRLNKEFVVKIPTPFDAVMVPSMVRKDLCRIPSCEEIITPFTDENEPNTRLQKYPHTMAPWVRGVWLPVAKYGCDRKGAWTANWDWRVADDKRVYMRKQRKPLPASYK